MTTISPQIYQCLVIAKGLEFYAKTGMRINKSYTPQRLMARATEITGQSFKGRAYIEAANALRMHVGMAPIAITSTPGWDGRAS